MSAPRFDFDDPGALAYCPRCRDAFANYPGNCPRCDQALLSREQALASVEAAEQAREESEAAGPQLLCEAADSIEAGGIAARLNAFQVHYMTRRADALDAFSSPGPMQFLVMPEELERAQAALEDLGEVSEEELERAWQESLPEEEQGDDSAERENVREDMRKDVQEDRREER